MCVCVCVCVCVRVCVCVHLCPASLVRDIYHHTAGTMFGLSQALGTHSVTSGRVMHVH